MANVVHSIPGFAGGVSQQSPVMRLDTQCTESVNTSPSVATGLNKRPNGDFIKKLTLNTSTAGYFTHRIHRDSSEKYLVTIGNNASDPIQVHDLDGNEKTVVYERLQSNGSYVSYPAAKSYLSSVTNAKTQLKAVSIADYTIIANNQKTTAMDSDLTDAADDLAFVWVKRTYTGSYSITWTWTHATAGTQTCTMTYANAPGSAYGTHDIAWLLISSATAHTGIAFTQMNNIIQATPSGDCSNVYVSRTIDPYGNEGMVPISYCAVQKLEELPPKMSTGVTLKISGAFSEDQDDYYMTYDASSQLYYESKGFGLEYSIDMDTMPHRLIRKSDGTFAFGPCVWSERTVGDDDTNLQPSFIGQKINNLRFHKNRLWLFSNDNAIGSKSGDYFNFWRSTVLDVLDDDPIDVAGTGEQVCNIRASKGFDKGIMLISDEEQFVLTSGDQGFTPKSVAIDSTTEFAADPTSDPIKLGPDVYFVSPKGSYLSLRQYTIMPDTLVQDAYDITSHVEKYIPAGTSMMAGSNQLDMIFLHTDADPTNLYVHKFLWNGNNKVQQAWFKWTFDETIIGLKCFGSKLYVIFYDATNGYVLQEFNLENVELSGQDFRYHLDSLHSVSSGSYSDPDTTFTLSVDVGDGTGWTVIDGSDSSEIVANYTLSGTTLTIEDEDASANTYYVGKDYEMRHTMSEWYMRDPDGVAIIAGALQVRKLMLSFVSSGGFEVEVTALGRSTMTAEQMTGIKLGEAVMGSVPLLSGEKNFTIAADSKGTTVDIVSDSYLPVSIQMGAWYGTHTMEGTLV